MLGDSDTDLFQRLSLDESLRRTFAVYKAGFLLFTTVAGLVVLVDAVIWSVLIPVLTSAFGVVGSEFADSQYLMDHMGAFYAINGIRMVLSTLIGSVGEGTMITAVANLYLQREPKLSTSLKTGAKKSPALIGAVLLSLVGGALGFVLLVVPGLYLSVAWFVITPAIVIEGYGVMGSFGRSMNLVSGSWCYVLCTYMCVCVFMLITQVIWSAVFAGGNDASHTISIFSVWGSAVAMVPAIVYGPVFAIMKTVMYINLRVEKEAVNADVLARGFGVGGSDVSYRLAGLMDDDEECQPEVV